MSRDHVVVVGASLAGLRTVQALRRLGDDSRVTMVGDEDALPYDRPPLSKGVLLGKVEVDALELVDRATLNSLDVELLLGTPASDLDVGRRTVAVGDDTLRFDHLVVATGSSARTLPDLPALSGVHTLRTLGDALAIRSAFERRVRVCVVGGGFIGAEIASSARTLGLDVTIVDPMPVLMHRGLGDVVGARMTDLHRQHGVDLRLGRTVRGLLGTGAVEGVVLDDGAVVPADLVVVGVGATPNTAWLASSGLALADGVLCDGFLSAAPGVHAVGDVARWHHPRYGRPVRAEHWTAATEHARAVAATLTGTPTAVETAPYVWTEQHGHRLQVCGEIRRGDAMRYLLDEPDRFAAVTGGDGIHRAAVALDAPQHLARGRMRIFDPWEPSDDDDRL